MEFSGAVLVSNEKIKRACDSYKPLHNESVDLIKGLIKRAEDGYETLSWWQREFSCNDMWYLKKHVYMKSLIRNVSIWNDTKNFFTAGWITEDQRDFHNNLQGDVYDQLTELIQAGEPVYLNVEQARFVNEYSYES